MTLVPPPIQFWTHAAGSLRVRHDNQNPPQQLGQLLLPRSSVQRQLNRVVDPPSPPQAAQADSAFHSPRKAPPMTASVPRPTHARKLRRVDPVATWANFRATNASPRGVSLLSRKNSSNAAELISVSLRPER